MCRKWNMITSARRKLSKERWSGAGPRAGRALTMERAVKCAWLSK